MNNVKKYTAFVEKIKHSARVAKIEYDARTKAIAIEKKNELKNMRKVYNDVINSTTDPYKKKTLEFKLKKEKAIITKKYAKHSADLDEEYRRAKVIFTKNYNIYKDKLDEAIKAANKRKKALKASGKGVKGYLNKGKKGIVDTAKKAGESWKSIPGKKPIFISAAILSAALSAALYKRYRDLENQRMKQLGLIK